MDRNEFLKQFCDQNMPELGENEVEAILNLSLSACDSKTKMVIFMEEMAELQKEISKNIRGEGDNLGTLEEIADVYLCLEMLCKIMGFDKKSVKKAIDIKLIRERDRRVSEGKICENCSFLKGADEQIFDQMVSYFEAENLGQNAGEN